MRSAASPITCSRALVFSDSNPMTVALKHVQAMPEPPSTRTELPIPHELEQIVMNCLEKKPSDRPSSAREIAAMLDALDLPPWTEEDAALWWSEICRPRPHSDVTRHDHRPADLRAGIGRSDHRTPQPNTLRTTLHRGARGASARPLTQYS